MSASCQEEFISLNYTHNLDILKIVLTFWGLQSTLNIIKICVIQIVLLDVFKTYLNIGNYFQWQQHVLCSAIYYPLNW